MQIENNVSLKPFNTFGIDVKAEQYCNITTVEELTEVLSKHYDRPIFVLGGGSNILLTRDVDALVLHINIKGITITQDSELVVVKAMAGENWHEFVEWCIEQGYGGLENLSLIPGNVGTAPIQNIGAYGVELRDSFISCEVMDIETQQIRTFKHDECKFDYRDSIFKNELKGKCIITSVSFILTKSNHKLKTDYGAISSELESQSIIHPSIDDISKAVIRIRQSKLPDPKNIGNSGSFFKNPIISKELFLGLKRNFETIPSYPISETEVKIPAGWLIEKAGFKGKRFGNYGVHDKQALVLVNHGDANGNDIYKLAFVIQETVKLIFNINLETEVNIL